MSTRPAAVAGMFYPDDPAELKQMIQQFLSSSDTSSVIPKVLVLPHAGYIYSGLAAAQGYHLLEPLKSKIKRVVLLGPCHRVPVRGIAVPGHSAFATPLGTINLDLEAVERVAVLPFVNYSDEAHALEHSLEVHLPFLQEVLDDFVLVPMVVGETRPEQVAQVLQRLWGGGETLIVISSDLSHFLPYEVACEVDANTADKILKLDDSLEGDEACGCRPLNGLLHLAKQQGMHCQLLALCNSGDTAGDKRQVVGYGAFALQ